MHRSTHRTLYTGIGGTLLLLGLSAGPMLSMVDSSVVNVALASITRSLGSSLATTQWIASGYLLATAVALPATAYLARRFGSITTYLGSIAGFTLTSALCALAPNAEVLIGLRFLQGALGAPLIPLAITLFMGGGDGESSAAPAGAAPVLGGIVFFLAPALGPTIGGILIDSVGWPWIFWINVPVGLMGILAVLRVGLDEPRDRSARFDVPGFLLLGLGTGFAVYGATAGPQVGWLDLGSLPFWAAGGILILVYAGWARRRDHPLLDLRLLRPGIAHIGIAVATIVSVVMYAMLILVPTYLQLAQGVTPVQAGLVLLPQAVVTGVGVGVGSRLAGRFGVRRTTLAGMIALVAGTVSLLAISGDTPPWVVAGLLCVRGFAVGLATQPLLAAMQMGLSRDEATDFSTLFTVALRVGGSVGIAVFLTFFQVREQVDIAAALAPAGGLVSARVIAAAASQALGETSLALVGSAVLGMLLALALPRASVGAPRATAGRQRNSDIGTASQPSARPR